MIAPPPIVRGQNRVFRYVLLTNPMKAPAYHVVCRKHMLDLLDQWAHISEQFDLQFVGEHSPLPCGWCEEDGE